MTPINTSSALSVVPFDAGCERKECWTAPVTPVKTSSAPLCDTLATKTKQSILLTISHPREAAVGEGGVTLEVFDEEFGDPHNFLGQVKTERYVRFLSEDVRVPDATLKQQ